MNKNFTMSSLIFISAILFMVFNSCKKDVYTEGGLLWEISGKDLEVPSYLLGTNHGMHGDFVDSIPGFWDTFNSIEQFALESDYTNPEENQIKDSTKMFLPKGITYCDLLDYDNLMFLDSILVTYSTLNSQKMNLAPGKLLVNLQVSMLKRESRKWAKENPYLQIVHFKKSIDFRLLKIAKYRSYPIIGLDDDKHLDELGLKDWSFFFESDSLRNQAQEMIAQIRKLQEDRYMLKSRRMMEAYYQQDLKLIGELCNDPELLETDKVKLNNYALTTQRNLLWMPKILTSIMHQSTFIMVGVAHLEGKNGLINLLRKEGYEVTPKI